MFDHGLGGWEIIAILVLFMVLFGAKRLPESARSLGRSMRIFKSEVKGLHDDDAQPARVTPQPDAVVQPAALPAGQPPVVATPPVQAVAPIQATPPVAAAPSVAAEPPVPAAPPVMGDTAPPPAQPR